MWRLGDKVYGVFFLFEYVFDWECFIFNNKKCKKCEWGQEMKIRLTIDCNSVEETKRLGIKIVDNIPEVRKFTISKSVGDEE